MKMRKVVGKSSLLFELQRLATFKTDGKSCNRLFRCLTSLLDLKTKEVSKEIFELLGIQEYVGFIPQPKYATEHGGTITKEVAELTGL